MTAAEGSVGSAVHRQVTAVGGSSPSTLHPRADTVGGAVRAAALIGQDAGAVASPDRAAAYPYRASPADRGVAAAESPARFCLIIPKSSECRRRTTRFSPYSSRRIVLDVEAEVVGNIEDSTPAGRANVQTRQYTACFFCCPDVAWNRNCTRAAIAQVVLEIWMTDKFQLAAGSNGCQQ